MSIIHAALAVVQRTAAHSNSDDSRVWTDPTFWAIFMPLIVAVIAAIEASRRDARQRATARRAELAEMYGDALADALAWKELPYRIARRLSNDSEEMTAIIERFHTLQERLDHHQSWLQLDSDDVGARYQDLVMAIKAGAGPKIHAAYGRAPVAQPKDLILGDFDLAVDANKECDAYVGAVKRRLNEVSTLKFFGRR